MKHLKAAFTDFCIDIPSHLGSLKSRVHSPFSSVLFSTNSVHPALCWVLGLSDLFWWEQPSAAQTVNVPRARLQSSVMILCAWYVWFNAEGLAWDARLQFTASWALLTQANQMIPNCSAGGKWGNKNKRRDFYGGDTIQRQEREMFFYLI